MKLRTKFQDEDFESGEVAISKIWKTHQFTNKVY